MLSVLRRRKLVSLLLIVILVLALFLVILFSHLPKTFSQNITPSFTLKTVTYCSPGGEPQLMDMYIPDHSDNTRMPLVEMVHGGGWTSGSKATLHTIEPTPEVPQVLHELLLQGFIVTSINYRLAPKYKFPADIIDVKCSIRYLRDHAAEYHIDSNHIGLMGSSAGGHLVSLAGLARPDAGWDIGEYMNQSSAVQAVVDMFGPEYLASGIGNPALQAPGIFGPKRGMLYRASPPQYIATAPQTDPPFFILQGNKDTTVPAYHSLRFYKQLIDAGQTATLQMVQNAGHEFVPIGGPITPSAEQISTMVVQFLIKYLDGKEK